MGDLARKLGGYVDRLANRLIWRFASTPLTVPMDRPLVSFTFDDVPDSALRHGADILERQSGRGTFYISGGLAGLVERERTLISPAGCAELVRRGHELGCHTFSHRHVRALTGRELATDLDRNAAFLAAAGAAGRPFDFAFPYNAAWPPARARLRRRYRSCRAGGEAINRGPTDPVMLKAVEIHVVDGDLGPALAWVDDLVARPGWLIFVTHDVADRPTRFGCRPEELEAIVGHARQRGCDILTVAAALDRFGWRAGR